MHSMFFTYFHFLDFYYLLIILACYQKIHTVIDKNIEANTDVAIYPVSSQIYLEELLTL